MLKKLFFIVAIIAILFYAFQSTEAPITLGSRPSLITGSVLQVQSLHDTALDCTMHIYHDGVKKKTHQFILLPAQQLEFGLLELNWVFEPGDAVKIDISGYRSKEVNFENK